MMENATNDPGILALKSQHEVKQTKAADEYRASLEEYYRTHPSEAPKPFNH
jgi:hypothetical protein